MYSALPPMCNCDDSSLLVDPFVDGRRLGEAVAPQVASVPDVAVATEPREVVSAVRVLVGGAAVVGGPGQVLVDVKALVCAAAGGAVDRRVGIDQTGPLLQDAVGAVPARVHGRPGRGHQPT